MKTLSTRELRIQVGRITHEDMPILVTKNNVPFFVIKAFTKDKPPEYFPGTKEKFIEKNKKEASTMFKVKKKEGHDTDRCSECDKLRYKHSTTEEGACEGFY